MGFSVEKLRVETSDGHNFTLLDGFTYTTKSGEVISVPAGTTSDGASTPKAMWNIIPPFGPYWKAAFLHDFLYRYTQKSKEYCDNIIDEAMDSLGVNDIEADTIYEGVHLLGWSSFEGDRKSEISTIKIGGES